ncbi:hypothetical protein ACTID9_02725 [Brevibacillus fluminis]|uniref:hypothetical protein n=1 Tax=Brevibacillus fluminis TaxID=511487 RepID=UPI003F8C9017
MKAKTMIATAAISLGLIGTAFAAGVSPYGQTGDLENVALTVDNKPIADKGILVNGQLYIPAKALSDQKKIAFYYDKDSYNAYLFSGGGDSEKTVAASVAMYTSSMKNRDQIAKEIMQGIPYETDDYHSGMMMQDITNITALAKGLLTTSDSIENVIQMRLSQNKLPNLTLVRQGILYRTIPLDIMQDRMQSLADELGRQISSSKRRDMEHVADDIQKAVNSKEKAIDSLEDWVSSSDKRDLEDVRDYEKDAKKYLYRAIKDLTGEDLENPNKEEEGGLKQAVEEWIRKKAK